ncbi:18383_t:CDS:2, partial [Gigaspora rosea]
VIQQKPWARVSFQHDNKTWILREIDTALEYNFDNDSIFQNLQENGSDYMAYRIIQYYPNLFNSYNQTIKAFQKETRLENAMKRVAHELNNKIDENELPIINGILLEHQGKCLALQETQALILTNNDEQFDTEESSNDLLKVINENINKTKLGSTILVDSKQYLILVFSQPCANCGNIQISKHTYLVDTIGFSVKCQIICHLCGGIIENDNEPKNIHFTKAFSVAALVG